MNRAEHFGNPEKYDVFIDIDRAAVIPYIPTPLDEESAFMIKNCNFTIEEMMIQPTEQIVIKMPLGLQKDGDEFVNDHAISEFYPFTFKMFKVRKGN